MKILKFVAKDVLRLSVVEITPDGNLVILGGKNGAGKSSVLDGINMTLRGRRATPTQPIRRGATKAEVVLDLGDLRVRRVITQGADRLVVERADGTAVLRPQEALDRIVGDIALDPLEFSRMSLSEQASTLRALVELDTSKLDVERADVFAERTSVNRDGQALKARVDAMPHHVDAPAAEVSIADLATELDRRTRHNADVGRAAEAHRRAEGEAARLAGVVERLRRELAEAEAVAERAAETAHAAAAKAASMTVEDTANLREQIAGAEVANRAVRDNTIRASAVRDLDALREKSSALTARLDAIDAEKTRMTAEARFPVAGLGFGQDGAVTFDGLPFAQASTAEKLRISVAMAVAANPKLRVFFVRDGSLLDTDSLRLLADLAREADAQVWIEDARTADPTAIIIEDGHVKEAP